METYLKFAPDIDEKTGRLCSCEVLKGNDEFGYFALGVIEIGFGLYINEETSRQEIGGFTGDHFRQLADIADKIKYLRIPTLDECPQLSYASSRIVTLEEMLKICDEQLAKMKTEAGEITEYKPGKVATLDEMLALADVFAKEDTEDGIDCRKIEDKER